MRLIWLKKGSSSTGWFARLSPFQGADSTMQKLWQDFGLFFLGLLVMVLGIVFPIYLFHTEGADSVFGNVVYVIAGALLFLAGFGILFYRVWMRTIATRQA